MKRFCYASVGAILVAGAFMIYSMRLFPGSAFLGIDA